MIEEAMELATVLEEYKVGLKMVDENSKINTMDNPCGI
jgi:hypothetical protein